MRQNEPPDDELVRYLLGALSDDEAEPIDAASVTDDDFALRLAAVESDLVDAYVRGELERETLERFETWYLASDARREKVAVARALFARERRDRETPAAVARRGRPASGSPHRGGLPPVWAQLAAAAVILLTSGALLFFALRPETPVGATARREAQQTPDQQTQREPPAAEPGRSAVPQTPPTPDSTAAGRMAPLVSVSVLLAPQTRAGGEIATLSIPRGTERVTARLQLEFDEFSRYRAALKDPATDEIVWRSGTLRARAEGERQTVSVEIPAALLRTQNYSVELAGVSDDGASEFMGTYVFRAVLE